MFFYEGYICPVCKQKFQESDDIVACPQCGAPHHRTCWLQEGHCHFEDDHGTTRQWKRPEESSYSSPATPRPVAGSAPSGQVRTCSRCGKVNPEFSEFCSRCGQNLTAPDWSANSSGSPQNNVPNSSYGHSPYPGQPPTNGSPFPGGYGEYTPFHMPIMDPYGGVAHDENVGDVSAEDMVAFVGPNSAYYLPRFYKMTRNGSHASWNWPAFLFTPYWLLYRKNYLAGGIILFLSIVQTLLNSFILGFYIQPALDMSSDTAMFDSLYALIEGGKYNLYFAIISLLFFANLLVRIIFGLISNSLYLRTSLTRIHRIREITGMDRSVRLDSPQDTAVLADYRRELTVQGGVSLVLIAVASGIVWFGQMLFQALFLYA